MSWNPNPPPPDPPDYDTSLPIYQNTGDLVSWGYKYIYYLGSQAFDTATAALNSLAGMTFPDAPTIDFPDFPVLDVSFDLPADPTLPTIDTTLDTVPAEPTLTVPDTDDLPEAPVYDIAVPDITIPDAPAAFAGTAPDAPDVSFDLTLPDSPDIDLPDEPVLTGQTLPDAPDITVPEFTAVAPLAPTELPDATFSYSEDAYARQIDVKAVVLDMLAGNSGLPPAIEQALFDRARSHEDITAKKAVDEAFEDWSSRGFSLPGGEIAKRVEAARQNNQNQSNTLNRDILVKSWDIKVENLKFAVQQGIAYEAQLLDLHNQAGTRKLQAAELTVRLALECFNAEVALYNAQIAGFNAKAEVYRTQLQESSQKIEVYKGQLQAAQIIGELNVQQVQLYSELVKAQVSRIDIYKAEIDGVKAESDLKRAQVEQYKALVEGFSASVQAKKAEFEAYGEQVKAESVKGDIFKSLTDAFSSRVRAYGSNVDAVLSAVKAQTDIENLKITSYQATLAAVRERITAKSQLGQLQSSLFDAQARVYTAKAGAVGDTARSTIAAYSAQVQTATSQSQIAIANANLVSENAGRNATLAVEAQKGIAQVSSQIAAGALAAVNVHTQLSSSGNYSASATTNVSYGVDGGEAEPPALPY
jgi:hypothetical protein